eukprot:gene6585-13319_t
MSAMKMALLKNKSKSLMPLLGLGTWKSSKLGVYSAVIEAVKIGYRHIDCAAIYDNESEVGDALQECIKNGFVQREELFITTKLWNNMHSKNDVPLALEQSLAKLKLDYVDLYLIHWPVVTRKDDRLKLVDQDILNPTLQETWGGMINLYKLDQARAIGVSNFSTTKMAAIEGMDVIPHVIQIEMHPMWRQDNLLNYCKTKGIHVTAYAPLGSPDSGSIPSETNQPNAVYTLPDNIATALHHNVIIMKHPIVQKIAAKYNKTEAQILLAWGMQRGTTVIPKSVNPIRLRSNFESVSIVLEQEDFDALSSFEKQTRIHEPVFWTSPTSAYKTTAELWA